jgi:hypothetical protein
MPRKANVGAYIQDSAAANHPSSFEVESAAAGATVDVLDTALTTAVGYIPTLDQFLNDFRFVRIVTATPSEDAADTIGITRITRNGGGTGYTFTFSAAAASGKKVRVRGVAL